MRIERKRAQSVMPRLCEVLFTLKNEKYYNREWGMRSPLAICNISLLRVLEGFEWVFRELDNLEIGGMTQESGFEELRSTDWGWGLVRAQEWLLHGINQHFDDLDSIFVSFHQFDGSKSSTHARRNMFKAKYEELYNSIEVDRKYVSSIVNHLKHEHGQMCTIVMFNHSVAILGYFVESVEFDDAGNTIIVPHPKVHAPYNGQSTAFSFNCHLRYLFWIVYKVSELCAEELMKKSSDQAATSFGSEPKIEERWFKVARKLIDMPARFFPDEVKPGSPFPLVRVDNNENLVLEYPGSLILIPPVGSFTVVRTYKSDGVTGRFKLPYFDRNHPDVTVLRNK